MEKAKILIADDEAEILEILGMLLEGEGYTVVKAHSGREAIELAADDIDLYILDVGMPEMSGFAAAMQIRKKYMAPMMFLTAYSGEADRELGFSAGADDYMVKPFSNTELLLKVKALLRRSRQYSAAAAEDAGEKESPRKVKESAVSAEDKVIKYKDIVLDLDCQSVSKGGEMIRLTYTEFRILELFLTHPKKIFSMDNIYSSVWGDDVVGDETIMVHIKNIRKKLGDSSKNPEYIKTAWGKGYYVD